MKKLRLLWSLPLIAGLTACGGTGSSAPAPTHFQVVAAQDSQLYMTWDAVPGVEYYVFCAPGVSTLNSHTDSATHSGWFEYVGYFPSTTTASYYATSLTNGTQYACTVNGRTGTAPGGPDATPQVGTPTMIGASSPWSNGAASGATLANQMTVKSVAYGGMTNLSALTDQFVAVGANGMIAVSTAVGADATVSWAAPTQATDVATDLNAVAYGSSRFVAVGTGGRVAYANNASPWTWASATIPGTPNMNAVGSSTASSYYLAVGDSGYVSTSADAVNWATAYSVSGSNLRSVVYVPSATSVATTPYWIAVGDAGTVVKSVDNGATWTSISGLTQNLKSIAVMPVLDSNLLIASYTLVAAGSQGLVYSNDSGATWTAVSAVVPSSGFVSVAAGHGGFMAVAADGTAYTSPNGSNGWSSALTTGLTSAATVLRYSFSLGVDYKYLPTQHLPEVSGAWMVLDASGNQRLTR